MLEVPQKTQTVCSVDLLDMDCLYFDVPRNCKVQLWRSFVQDAISFGSSFVINYHDAQAYASTSLEIVIRLA